MEASMNCNLRSCLSSKSLRLIMKIWAGMLIVFVVTSGRAHASAYGTQIFGSMGEYCYLCGVAGNITGSHENGPSVGPTNSLTTQFGYENTVAGSFIIGGQVTVTDPMSSSLFWLQDLSAPAGLNSVATDQSFINGDASLYTGTIRAWASSTGENNIQPGSLARISPTLNDSITIDAPASMLNSGFYVTFTTYLAGNLYGSPLGSDYVFYTYTPISTSFGQGVALTGGTRNCSPPWA